MSRHTRWVSVSVLAVLALTGCSDDDTSDTVDVTQEPGAAGAAGADDASEAATSLVGATPAEQFPDIVGVEADFDDAAGTWSFAVTVSSPYDTPERYADGWRVVGPDGDVFGVHMLAHDHATEQPFTRSLSGVEIPDDVERVTIEGRDLAHGWGGAVVEVGVGE